MRIEELNTLSAVLVTAMLLVCLCVDLAKDVRRLVSGRNVVLIGIFAWFLIEGLTLSPELRLFPQSTYDFSIFCVTLAMAAFLVTYHYSSGCLLFAPLAQQVRVLDDRRMLWRLIVICSAIGFAPILYYSGLDLYNLVVGIFGMRKSWGGLIARSRYGDFRSALLMLEFFVTGVGPFAAIYFFDRRNPILQRLFAGFVAIWPVLRAFGGGTRSSLLTSMLPILAIVYLKLDARSQRRLVVIGLLCSPLAYHFMGAVQESRGTGKFDWAQRSEEAGVGNQMLQELAFIVETIPTQADYQFGYSYYVQLVNPIPRFLWAGKPTLESGILMARLKGEINHSTGEVYLTRSPGLIGEMYMNFGLPGIIILSGLGGWLVRGWDRVAPQARNSLVMMTFYCAMLPVLFILGRSFTANMFYGMVFFLIGLYVLIPSQARLKQFRVPVRKARAVVPARV